jgi:hypothetical protein
VSNNKNLTGKVTLGASQSFFIGRLLQLLKFILSFDNARLVVHPIEGRAAISDWLQCWSFMFLFSAAALTCSPELMPWPASMLAVS